MKKLRFLALMLMATLIQSCVPEDPATPDTGDVRDKFTGSWTFIETSPRSMLKSAYVVEISPDPSNSSRVLLSNFGGAGLNAAYGIATAGSITVPSQSTGPDCLVDGTGTLVKSNTMDWTYSVTAGGDRITSHATATRQ